MRLEAADQTSAFRALVSDQLPPALRLGSFKTRAASAGTVFLEGYRGIDELAAPAVVLEILTHLDGRPLDEVLAQVEAETGVTLEQPFLSKLVDFEILVPLGRRS